MGRKFDPVGDARLPNGAQILDRRKIGEYWLWFANYGGVQPYVTWISHTCNPGETYWGHYFSEYPKGYDDFCERIREKWLSEGHGSVS